MTPLGAVVAGLLVVLLDLRVAGVDLLLDPVGWLIVLRAVRRVPVAREWSHRVRWAAAVSALLSLVDVLHPVGRGGADASHDGLPGVVQELYGIAVTVTLVLLALALRDRAQEAGDVGSAGVLQRFAWLLAALGVAVLLLGWVVPAVVDETLLPAVALLALGLVDLVVAVCFVIVLARRRHRPWLQEAAEEVRAA